MGFRHKFAYSFFDFSAYKEFLVQGLGKSIIYMFVVTLIFSTITSINTINTFISETSKIESRLVKNIPNFELKNGILSIDSDKPIYNKFDGQQIIVDTSGKTSKSSLDSYSDGIYINAEELIIRQNYRTLQTFKFSDFTTFNLTNKTMQNILSSLKIIFPIVLLFLNPIISFLLNLISGFLVVGPLSLSISYAMGVNLKYPKACTISFYAMTLPIVLESLLDISGMDLPEFFIIFYIISLIYSAFAINEIKNTNKSNLNIMK